MIRTLNDLDKLPAGRHDRKMPLLFLGHGSPMNAIEENEFTQGFRASAERVPVPAAIVCISAHWETSGTRVTAMKAPRTIHDFGGFPQALYEVQYPAPGDPALASRIASMTGRHQIELDHAWGLDHGAWSVIKHMYPRADIPVVQLSLDYNKSPREHYGLAAELGRLREKGVLVIGSGNMVHNLGMVAWNRLGDGEYGYDWALEANARMKELVRSGDHPSLIAYETQGRSFAMAIPTPEHYLPLLYVLAMKEDDEEVTFFNDRAVGGSLTMTSVKITG